MLNASDRTLIALFVTSIGIGCCVAYLVLVSVLPLLEAHHVL